MRAKVGEKVESFRNYKSTSQKLCKVIKGNISPTIRNERIRDQQNASNFS